MQIKSLMILATGLLSASAFAENVNNNNAPPVVVTAPPGSTITPIEPTPNQCVTLVGTSWTTATCAVPKTFVQVQGIYLHTSLTWGRKDGYSNPKNFTFYIVGRQGGIGVTVPFDNSSYTALGQLNPISLDQLTPLQVAQPASGNLSSIQPSPLHGMNARVDEVNGHVVNLTGIYGYTMTATFSKLSNGLNIPNGDQIWHYKEGETLAYLQGWTPPDATGKTTALPYSAPCNLKEEMTVGDILYVHYTINTYPPVTYSCYVDLYR